MIIFIFALVWMGCEAEPSFWMKNWGVEMVINRSTLKLHDFPATLYIWISKPLSEILTKLNYLKQNHSKSITSLIPFSSDFTHLRDLFGPEEERFKRKAFKGDLIKMNVESTSEQVNFILKHYPQYLKDEDITLTFHIAIRSVPIKTLLETRRDFPLFLLSSGLESVQFLRKTQSHTPVLRSLFKTISWVLESIDYVIPICEEKTMSLEEGQRKGVYARVCPEEFRKVLREICKIDLEFSILQDRLFQKRILDSFVGDTSDTSFGI